MAGSFVLDVRDKREPIQNLGFCNTHPYPDRSQLLLAGCHADVYHNATISGVNQTINPGDQNVILTVGSTDINGFFGVTPLNSMFTGNNAGFGSNNMATVNEDYYVGGRLTNDDTNGGATQLTSTVRLASLEKLNGSLSVGTTVRYFYRILAGEISDTGNHLSSFSLTSVILTFKLMNTSGTLTTIGATGDISTITSITSGTEVEFGYKEHTFTPQTTSAGDRLIVEVETIFTVTGSATSNSNYAETQLQLGANGSPRGFTEEDGYRPFEISIA